MFPATITTNNLILRPPIIADCQEWAWDNNPTIQEYLPEPHPHLDITDQQEFFEEIREEPSGWYWSIVAQATQECIGIISITQINTHHGVGELGIVIGKPEYHQKGYATESIQAIINYLQKTSRLRRISAECESENVAMVKVLAKSGMIQEAIRKQSRVKKSYPIDTIVFHKILN